MELQRENLREGVLSLINASRELSPAEDDVLAETFLRHLEQQRAPRRRKAMPQPLTFASLTALAILLAIPVVMSIQTYSDRDGYLPPADAGALPLVYWVALAVVVVILLTTLVRDTIVPRVQARLTERYSR